MKTIKINGSFADCITGLVDPEKIVVPWWAKHKEIMINNEDDKDKIITLFKECDSFNILEDEITFVLNSTQEEINKYIDDRIKHTQYGINRLRKWMDAKEEWNIQITEYLEYKELQWILDELNEYSELKKWRQHESRLK